jgi:hypothetical protein
MVSCTSWLDTLTARIEPHGTPREPNPKLVLHNLCYCLNDLSSLLSWAATSWPTKLLDSFFFKLGQLQFDCAIACMGNDAFCSYIHLYFSHSQINCDLDDLVILASQ